MSQFKGVFKKYKDLLHEMAEDVAFSENDETVKQKRRGVYISVYDILVNEVGAQWCIHKEFIFCIEESKKREGFRPDRASEAFYHIEHYILLILLMPWKMEYRKIKKYSGFYQNAIENVLSGIESILKLVGFIELEPGILSLTKIPNIEGLKYIAFECFVSSALFKIMEESMEKARLSRDSKSKVMYAETRLPNGNTGKYTAQRATNESDGVKSSVPIKTVTNKSDIDRASTEDHRTRLLEHMKQAQKLAGSETVSTDFPFMDDVMKQSMEFEEGTLEDHVKASLQLVENNESTPTAYVEPQPRNVSASQEWSFVHEGLKEKFGNQYFDGPRKNILDSDDKDIQSDRIVKHKPDLRPVKFGDNPWQGKIHKPSRQLTEGHFKMASAYDSAYQSGIAAQFPPSIPSERMLSRSASAGYPKKFDTDIVIKKTNQGAFSKTAPILRRTSAPVKQETKDLSESLVRQFGNLQIDKGNVQGADTLKRELNDLSKGTGSGKGLGSSKVPISSMISSGLGESLNSRSNIGKSIGQGAPVARNDFDGLGTTSQTQIPNSWHCANCTYLNDCSSNVCIMCSKTRDGNLDTDLPSVGSTSKICDKCTFENDCSATLCQVCGNTLKGSQTVV